MARHGSVEEEEEEERGSSILHSHNKGCVLGCAEKKKRHFKDIFTLKHKQKCAVRDERKAKKYKI